MSKKIFLGILFWIFSQNIFAQNTLGLGLLLTPNNDNSGIADYENMKMLSLEYNYKKHALFVGYDKISEFGYFMFGYKITATDLNKKTQFYFPFTFYFREIYEKQYNSKEEYFEDEKSIKLMTGIAMRQKFAKIITFYCQPGFGLKRMMVETNNYWWVRNGKENRVESEWQFELMFGLYFNINLKKPRESQ